MTEFEKAINEQYQRERMRRINEQRESENLPLFKTLDQFLEWAESEVEYDN